jgi:hypothetical protein
MAAASATQLTARDERLSMPAFQAFVLLRTAFTVAPILFGLDKFFELTADWSVYLWPGVADALPLSADTIMLTVGVVEIAAGLLVAVAPRIGGVVVAAWLATIIVNLLLLGEYLDIALRDFGLLVAAVALTRLASAFAGDREAVSPAR